MTAPDPAEVERLTEVLADIVDDETTLAGMAAAILSAGYSRTADTLERAARIADTAHLVPPDGGSPTEAECNLARDIAAAIRAEKGEG